MRLTAPILVFLLLSVVDTTLAQTTHRIPSGDSEIVLSHWTTNDRPEAPVLMLPGWGGGPDDVLGLGSYLSQKGVEVYVLTPRGWHESGGTATFENALEDIGNALAHVRSKTGRPVILGGHSFGGGMSLAYAAGDSTVERIFSIAGTDHALLIRKYVADSTYAEMVDRILTSTKSPAGPIRFDQEYGLNELKEGQDRYGLLENANALSDRSILLLGGWEDANVTVDRTLLPLYRALRPSSAADVDFFVYHTDHSFRSTRNELHEDLLEWIVGQSSTDLEDGIKPGVTGIGGIFFKSEDPDKLRDWYRKHLGIDAAEWGGFPFLWRENQNPNEIGYTVWGPFRASTEYFAPSELPYMINYRVTDLDSLLVQLRANGVPVIGEIDQQPNGKFGWIMDPEGRKIELWEPVPSSGDPYIE